MVIRFERPAERWIEALPVGNGRLGAMVFGARSARHIQVNEHTVWEGHLEDRVSPTGLANLPEIRRLLFAGQYSAAQKHVEQHMLHNRHLKSYQPLCSLLLAPRSLSSDVRATSRQLDLATGIHLDSYESHGRRFACECFCSMADGVLVVRLSCDKPHSLNQVIRLDREQDVSTSRAEGNRLVIEGRLGEDGVRYRAEAIVLHEGGTLRTRGNAIELQHAESITVLLAGATSFMAPGDLSGDPAERCRVALEGVAGKDYAALRADHVRAHRGQMERVSLTLDAAEDRDEMPTEGRLAAFTGPARALNDEHLSALADTPADWGFFAQLFQACRYMLITASQPGSQPSTLQGRWCGEMNPPWNSDYHPNINLQMNYWLANPCNLAECNLPLMQWLESCARAAGADTARRLYGCRGWVMHHVSDIFATTAPMDGPQGVWPVGGAWMCHHIWEHYQFTRDLEFLQRYAPLIFSAARFLLDFLVEAPANSPQAGRLVTAPSHSPENTFLGADGERAWICVSAAMDTQIIDQLLRDALEAMRELALTEGEHAALRQEIESAIKRLPPMQVSPKSGRLLEWLEEFDEPEPGHRHMSHLFALYPGDGITPTNTPDLAAAAVRSIDHRLSHDYHATGWSLPWLACIFARLGDGERALDMLTHRIAHFTMPNALFSNAHGHPQVGDACGFAAAIAEMLLQSHEGFIHVLPALPAAWQGGEVKGLCARGGFELDIAWSASRPRAIAIRSRAGGTCRILTPARPRQFPEHAKMNAQAGKTLITFATQPGGEYTIIC